MEYEVDLRRYALLIIRRWRLILLSSLLFAMVAGGLSLMKPKSYVAAASVLLLIKETETEVAADDTILSVESINSEARRTSLIALAQSNAIEVNLPPEVVANVTPDDYKPGMLLANDFIMAYPVGDLLEIRATGESPEQAKQLADAWMQTYVDYVKPLYPDGHSEVRAASTAILPFREVSRGIFRNAALAGAAGLLLGVLLALVLDLVRRPAPAPRRAEGERVVGGHAPHASKQL